MNKWFQKFKFDRRGYYSLILFGIIFGISLCAELVANDRPLIVKYKNHFYFPIFTSYSEKTFGGNFETAADFRDVYVKKLINQNGWMIFPLVPYSYNTITYDISSSAPSSPSKYNWLGTDDNGRDVVARLIYGLRTALIFGLILTFSSALIGIILGALQGYFGGLIDLFFQRFMD